MAKSNKKLFLEVASKFDDRGLKTAQSGISKFGSSLKKIAKVGAVAFAAIGAGSLAIGKQAIAAAEAAQVADNRLAKINESMGLFGAQTARVTKRMQEFADQTMLATGIDDEQIKATQAKLLTFRELAKTADVTGGAFDRATKAALDLAAAGFGSAESNATMLGKALQDPVKGLTALTRVGVTFTKEQKAMNKALIEGGDANALVALGFVDSEKVFNDQIKSFAKQGKTVKDLVRTYRSEMTPAQKELYDSLLPGGQQLKAQEELLKAIETQVGGTAEATVTASKKMEVAFGELQEKLGFALMPIMDDLLVIVQDDLIPVLEDMAAWVGENVVPAIRDFLGVIKEFVKRPEAVAMFEKLGKSFDKLATEAIRFGNSDIGKLLGELTGGIILTGLGSLATLLERVATSLQLITDATDALSGKRGAFFSAKWWLDVSKAAKDLSPYMSIFDGIIRLILSLTGVKTPGQGQGQDSTERRYDPRRGSTGNTTGVTPFANGGIVTRPVMGLVGEAGPEAIIPLNRAGGLGGNYYITVNAGMGTNGAQVGRDIVEAIRKYEKTSGRVFARA